MEWRKDGAPVPAWWWSASSSSLHTAAFCGQLRLIYSSDTQSKKQKELPQEKGIILGQQPQMKEQHEQHFSFKVMSSGGASQRCPVP